MKRKNIIRLNEAQLHRVIKESVKRILRENVQITDRLDAMYKNGDYSKLYSDPRLCREDVWFEGEVELLGNETEDYFVPEEANYLIEDYLETHNLDDIVILGGDHYNGYQGEYAAEVIVNWLLGKSPEEIKQQLADWVYTGQL